MNRISEIFSDMMIGYKNFFLWNVFKAYSVVVSFFIWILFATPVIAVFYFTWSEPIQFFTSENLQKWEITINFLLSFMLYLIGFFATLHIIFLNTKLTIWLLEDNYTNDNYHFKLLALIPLAWIGYHFFDRYPWFAAMLLVIALWTFAMDIYKELKNLWKFLIGLCYMLLPLAWILVITFLLGTLVSNVINHDLPFFIVVFLGVFWGIYFFIRSFFAFFFLASDINDWIVEKPSYYIKKSLEEIDVITFAKFLGYFILFSIPFIIATVLAKYGALHIPEWKELLFNTGLFVILFSTTTGYLTLFNASFFKNIILESKY